MDDPRLDLAPRDKPWQEVEFSLLQLAFSRGNAEGTYRRLLSMYERGDITWKPATPETLRKWRHRYAAEYLHLCQQEAPRIRQEVAEESVSLARRYAVAEGKALERLEENMDEIAPRDMANVVRNLATSKGIAVDKYEKIAAPEPDQTNAPAQLEALLKGLADKYPGLVPQVEVIEAEVVSETADAA